MLVAVEIVPPNLRRPEQYQELRIVRFISGILRSFFSPNVSKKV